MSTVTNTVVPTVVPTVVSSIASTSPASKFIFNGTNQFITIPGWQPYGLNFQIQAHGNPEGSFISDRTFYAGGVFDKLRLRAGAGTIQLLYVDNTDSPHIISTGTATLGEDTHMVGNFNAAQTSLVINGSAQSGEVAGPTLMAPITTMGADWDGGDYFQGPLWGFAYYDYSPIQDTDAKTSAVGTLPDIPMAEAVVSFDYIMPNFDEDILVGYLSNDSNVLIAAAGVTNLMVDGEPYVDKYMGAGQHIHVEFEVDGATPLTNINALFGMQNLTIESTVYE